MIYAASPALDGLRYVVLDEVHYLQDRYRGAVWEEVIIHLPADVDLVCLSATVSNAEEVAAWIADRARRDRGDHRGAPAGRRSSTSTWSGSGARDALHLLPTFVAAATASSAPTPTPPASTRARRGTRAPGPAPARGCARRGRVEVVERLAAERDAARDRVRVQPRPAATRRSSSASPPGCASPTPAERARAPRASPTRTTERARRRRPRRARLRRVARRARGRLRRAPRGHGAADEGGGRGGVRRRAGEGRVRDRDALARHQHAGPLGGDREAVEVHRRAPRVPHAGGVHAAHRAGRAPRHRRASATPSCCWSPFVPFDQVAGARVAPHRTRSRRRSARRTTWPPTSCAATRRSRPTTCSTCRSRSSTPTATSSRSSASSSARREQLARRREPRPSDPAATSQEYRRSLAALDAARRDRGSGRARDAGSTRSAPATSWSCRRRGGRVVGAQATSTGAAAAAACVALTPGRDVVRLGPDDFDGPPRTRRDHRAARGRSRPATRRSARQAAERAAPAEAPRRRRPRADATTPASPSSKRRVARPPAARRPGSSTPQLRGRGGGRAHRARRRTGSNAASAAAARAWPGSSTACSACSRRGATSTAGRCTDAGELLARLYTETDLVARRGAARGPARRPRPAELAAVVSCFTYERRGPDGNEPMPPRRWPTQTVAKRGARDRAHRGGTCSLTERRRAAARDPPARSRASRRDATPGRRATTSPTCSTTTR